MYIIIGRFFTTMNKGLTILARLGTSERMVVFIDPTQNDILKIINEKYGKDWVKVNELCVGDVLRFDAEQIYRGFDPQKNDDNYCEGCLEQGVLKEYVKPKLYA